MKIERRKKGPNCLVIQWKDLETDMDDAGRFTFGRRNGCSTTLADGTVVITFRYEGDPDAIYTSCLQAYLRVIMSIREADDDLPARNIEFVSLESEGKDHLARPEAEVIPLDFARRNNPTEE